LTADLCKR